MGRLMVCLLHELPIFLPTPALSCSLAYGTAYRKWSVTLPQVFPTLLRSGHPPCPKVKAPFPCLLCRVLFWLSFQVSLCHALVGRPPCFPGARRLVCPSSAIHWTPSHRAPRGPACLAGLLASAHALLSGGRVSLLAILESSKTLMNCAGPCPTPASHTQH